MALAVNSFDKNSYGLMYIIQLFDSREYSFRDKYRGNKFLKLMNGDKHGRSIF